MNVNFNMAVIVFQYIICPWKVVYLFAKKKRLVSEGNLGS